MRGMILFESIKDLSAKLKKLMAINKAHSIEVKKLASRYKIKHKKTRDGVMIDVAKNDRKAVSNYLKGVKDLTDVKISRYEEVGVKFVRQK